MSRKTRKLIWSVPLVATFAVMGALALFVVLAPNGVSAHDPQLPGPVMGLDAMADEYDSIKVTWDPRPAEDGVTGYRIDYSDDNRVWKFLAEVSSSTGTYMDTMDVNRNTRRWYRIFAINSVGIGPVSNEPVTADVVVADDFPPQRPSSGGFLLSVSSAGTNALDLTWTTPEERGSKITMYRVVEVTITGEDRVDCNTGEMCHFAEVTPSKMTSRDADLNPGEVHYYRVYAESDEGDTPSNVASGTTSKAQMPDPPGAPVAVPLADGTVELYWHEPAKSGGYPIDDIMYRFQFQKRDRDRTSADDTWNDWMRWSPWGALALDQDQDVALGTIVGEADARVTGTNAGLGTDSTRERELRYRMRSVQDVSQDTRSAPNAPTAQMSGWVNFNSRRPSIAFPVVAPGKDALVPLEPTLLAAVPIPDTMAEERVVLTWTDAVGDETRPYPTDYRIDVSDDGLEWHHGQINMSRLDDWEDYDVRDSDGGIKMDRHYRIFPINSRYFGQADYKIAMPMAAPALTTDAVEFSLEVEGTSTTMIELTWTKVPGAMSYTIEVAMEDNDGLAIATMGATGEWAGLEKATELGADTLSFTHEELSPGDVRWYRVMPKDSADEEIGNFSTVEARGVTEVNGIPNTPTGLVAEEAKDSSFFSIISRSPTRSGVLVLWDEPEEDDAFDPHTGYVVERSVNGGDWVKLDRSKTDLDTHHHDKEEPAANELRAYRVAALTGDNAGARSDTAYVGHNALAAPMDLSAMEASETKINLSWTAPNQGSGRVAYYQLERAYGDVMFLDAERTDNSAFMDAESWWDGLECAGMVEAVNDDGEAVSSNPFCKMYDGLADADETMVDEYFAKRYAIIEAPATMYMDTGLMTGTEYSYRLRSVHEVDGDDPDMHESLSDWSMTVMPTPAAVSTALTAPTMVMAESNAVGELALTWEGGANADSFLLIAVNMADTSDYKTAIVTDGGAQMGTVAGLTSGVNYLGIVVALQGTGADRTFTYGASGIQAVQ